MACRDPCAPVGRPRIRLHWHSGCGLRGSPLSLRPVRQSTETLGGTERGPGETATGTELGLEAGALPSLRV